MPESTIVKTKRDGTLTISDNAAVNSFTVSFEAGDLSLTIPGPGVGLFLDRGIITSPPAIRYTDDAPISGTFSAYLRDFSDAAYSTLMEILSQSGEVASTWVSTMGATGEVQTYTLTWTVEGTDHGDVSDHVCVLDHCAFTGSVSEGDPDSISLSFTSYALYPTLT